ncbi:trehalose-phosphatase [Flavobacterium sp. WG21]|uniref:trehalose-phosphatase n=1 Tax=Flavobacterium sp. WG21 TaxID=1229487 RepID=UPI000344929D|nr:trehalose-phosphatase [Flavobacterium sp. WG21]
MNISSYKSKNLKSKYIENIKTHYKTSGKKLILLDYDGTLVGFRSLPSEAIPDKELFELLDNLAEDNDTELVIISGRDRITLEEWFGTKEYTLITDHGMWLRRKGNDWVCLQRIETDWKEDIRPVLKDFAQITPGSFLEEKEYSLAWHYRCADVDLANLRITELKERLNSLLAKKSLCILEGKKVLEVKDGRVNKGRAASVLVTDGYDFIMAIGDDWTDEFMFRELPKSAYTIKVGKEETAARYSINDTSKVREILEFIAG